MTYKTGQIVSYNGAAYTVLGVKPSVFNGQEVQTLNIRNIVTDDNFWVDSKNVRLIDDNGTMKNNKNSFDFFEESSEEAERDLIDNKTEVINGLFRNVLNENTEQFFGGLDDTSEISDDKLEEIFDGNSDTLKMKDPSVTNDYVQNFSMPRSSVIKPRTRHQMDMNPVDATFSDLETIGQVPTREFVRNDLNKLHEPTQMIMPKREVNAARMQNQQVELPRSSEEPVWNVKPAQPKQDHQDEFKFADDISRLIKEDATDVQKIIEPGFSESSDDDITITSETKKVILEGLNDKANKFKEKQREILATGPINTGVLVKHLSNHDDQTSVLDEITNDAIGKGSSTDSILENYNENPNDIINKSKIYGSFKRMSAWLITFVVLLIFVPIIGIAIKIAGNFSAGLAQPMSLANIFSYGLSFDSSSTAVITTFVSTILVLIVTPTLLLTTLIYGTIFIVLTLKRQYRRLAFFNYQIQKGATSIEALQDFSNESSVFMLKLHGESKETKKQIKKLTKLSGMSMMKNIANPDQKEVH